MSDIDTNNIRRLDGGLLLIFRELLIHRRTGAAADALGLSQSAVSHALKRLRDIIGDPLFIRRSHGLEPTRRALELGPAIDALIDMANGIVSSHEAFDPGTTRRQFKIAVPDFMASVIGAGLAASFQREAPRSTFGCHQLIVDHALDAVRLGEVDLAIGHFASIPPDLETKKLFEDQYCVVVRKDHPLIQGYVSKRQYIEIDHVFVGRADGIYVPGSEAVREHARQAYGTIPDAEDVATTAYVAQWETALLIAASTDLIAECPRRLADKYAGPLALQILDVPFGDEMRDVLAVKRKGTRDAGTNWLLAKVTEASEPGQIT
jgi:DNA-binding transcriptional LysR family regulator